MTSELPYCLILPFQAFVLLNVSSVQRSENIYFEKSEWKHLKKTKNKKEQLEMKEWLNSQFNLLSQIVKEKIIKQWGNHSLKHWENVMKIFLNFVTFQVLWETSFHSFSCCFPISLLLHQPLLLPLNSVSYDFTSRVNLDVSNALFTKYIWLLCFQVVFYTKKRVYGNLFSLSLRVHYAWKESDEEKAGLLSCPSSMQAHRAALAVCIFHVCVWVRCSKQYWNKTLPWNLLRWSCQHPFLLWILLRWAMYLC